MSTNAENPAITAIWNYFAGKQVKEFDGTPLTYYDKYDCVNIDTEALLRTNEGQCGAWANFFLDVLEAQGIDRANDYVLVEANGTAGGFGGDGGFIVKNWAFAAGGGNAAAALPGLANLTAEFPYINLVPKDAGGNFITSAINATNDGYAWLGNNPDVTDQNGVDGQNNMDPKSLFNNHQFVQLDIGMGIEWFDPSYGVKYTGAAQADRELFFDDNSLAGYYVRGMADVLENVVNIDLNGNGNTNDTVQWYVYLFKQNTIGMRQVQVGAGYPVDY